jgi:hypothetical protein
MSTNGNGSWTIVDLIAAMAYAKDQINYRKCKDPDILKKICPVGKTDCLVWKENTNNKLWVTPDLAVLDAVCKTDDDCKDIYGAPQCLMDTIAGKKLCSFKPDKINSGTCNVATKELCDASSKLPYECDFKGNCKLIYEDEKCKTTDDCKKGKCEKGMCVCSSDKDCASKKCEKGICQTYPTTSYVEWRPNTTCSVDEPCISGMVCSNEGKCQCKEDGQCPGNGTCVDGVCTGGRCVIGNWPLKQWCEQPKSRCQPNKDGKYPSMCKGSANAPGVTDVPAFAYNNNSGACHITKPYCDYYKINYEGGAGGAGCTKDSDCGDYTNTCHMAKPTDTIGICVGPNSDCYLSTGQKVGEFIVGATVYRYFKSDISGCHNQSDVKEGYEPKKLPEQLNKIFSSYPEKVVVKGDKKDMVARKMIYNNYIGKVSLYYIVWLDGTKGVGIDASEVRKEFPKNVFKKDDRKVVMVKKSDVIESGDQKLKKLYLTLNSLHFFDNLIAPSNK